MLARILHDGRDSDAHDFQRTDQFAPHYCYCCQQELFPPLVGLAEDRMPVVERVEKLRELKDMLGEICGLRGRDGVAKCRDDFAEA